MLILQLGDFDVILSYVIPHTEHAHCCLFTVITDSEWSTVVMWKPMPEIPRPDTQMYDPAVALIRYNLSEASCSNHRVTSPTPEIPTPETHVYDPDAALVRYNLSKASCSNHRVTWFKPSQSINTPAGIRQQNCPKQRTNNFNSMVSECNAVTRKTL